MVFTVEEKRDAVVTYLGLAFGQKTAWLAQQPFTASQLRRWRSVKRPGFRSALMW